MKLNLSTAFALSLLATACTNSDNPQLSMCQAVAKQLSSNTISEWGDTSQSSNDRELTVKVAFTTNSNQSATLDCKYKKDNNGTTHTAPYTVSVNGQRVDDKILISAGSKATKELLAGTYKNTVAKSQELAAEASVIGGKALEVAEEVVGEVAKEAQKALQEGTLLQTDK